MSKNIIEIAINAGFINTSNGLESPFIEGEDLIDNLKLFASLLLAQPEHIVDVTDKVKQEPVAWMQDSIELYVREEKDIVRGYVIPLYTAPPKREPLSDEEVFDIGYKSGFAVDQDESADYESDAYGFLNEDGYVDNELYFKLVRAIEKAHGIGGE